MAPIKSTDRISLLGVAVVAIFIPVSVIQQTQSKPTADLEGAGSGLTSEQFHRTIHYQFDKKMEPIMQLHRFESNKTRNNITCNDGSQAGYYKRLNNHSKGWIIYLQGGGFCGSNEACRQRWRHSPDLMSSNFWPRTKSIDGILSSDPKENPYLWNANHIYIPYCSSDSWTGRTTARYNSQFSFMGSKIIESVIESLFEDLPLDSSLYDSRFILLAGDSAGATGVIMNLDRINKFIQQRFQSQRLNCSVEFNAGASGVACEQKTPPVVRGLADSGWFLDNEPYEPPNLERRDDIQAYPELSGVHTRSIVSTTTQDRADTEDSNGGDVNAGGCDQRRCTPLESIKRAMLFWNGQVPSACANRHPNEPWRCYFGYRVYQSLKTPLFVVQWLYDEVQMIVDNVGRPDSTNQWNYVNKVSTELKQSLENVSAFFAPSCFSHGLIIRQSWNQININGFRLPHVLNSWEEETLMNQPTLEHLSEPEPKISHSATLLPFLSQSYRSNLNFASSSSVHSDGEIRHISIAHHQQQSPITSRTKTRKRKRINNNNNNNNNNNQFNHNNKIITNTNRLSRSTSIIDDSNVVSNNNVPDSFQIMSAGSNRHDTEKFRLIDTCGWPQCNRDCPSPVSDLSLNLRPIIPY